MTAVILAAGISSRLRPLTDNVPKCLLPVGGIPLLERTLVSLQKAGLRNALIVTGYLREQIEGFVARLGIELEVTFVNNPVFDRTNNNYSLWLAGEKLSGEEILLLDADILFDRRIIPTLLSSQGENALVIRRSSALGKEEMKVECDEHGYVKRISKEIDPSLATGESLGIERFSSLTTAVLFQALGRRKDRYEYYEDSFQEIIDQGVEIRTVDIGQLPCVEIDTTEDLAAAERLAQSID